MTTLLPEIAGILSIPELETRARSVMPEIHHVYVQSGAADEHTVRWNRDGYDRIAIVPRVLSGSATVDTTIEILGTRLPFPILLAPTAYHKVLHPMGEIATARGAGAAGALWVVSSASTVSVEEISQAASGPLWFQLYVQSDSGFTREVVRRAVAAGCRALCLTVDTPVLGVRERQIRSGFSLPPGMETPHLMDARFVNSSTFDQHRVVLSWSDVEWIREIADVPLVIKGILDPGDAKRAVEHGADCIIVSNHGGRNLDTAVATIDILSEVVAAVEGRIPVLVDGGIRRGTDVLKALALGARGVLIGRPYCYGLALAGADGVQRTVEILRNEFELAMILTGMNRLEEIDRSVLRY